MRRHRSALIDFDFRSRLRPGPAARRSGLWREASAAACNVTIFGQSAGAMSVGTLLSMPRAEELFRRAIAQSGGAHQVISAATAQRVAQRLAEKLGVEARREAIAEVPIDRLLQAQAELNADLAANPDPERWGHDSVVNRMLWQPVVDGDVIPARPIDRIVTGAGATIDVLVGSTSDEWTVFLVPSGAIEQITDEALAAVIGATAFRWRRR